jgi:CO/xanthine dehydrogenase FAD-binding subunit
VQARDLEDLVPIDDVRATRSYRLDAAAELVRRVLLKSCES